jgi:hypothetical protein
MQTANCKLQIAKSATGDATSTHGVVAICISQLAICNLHSNPQQQRHH